MADRPSAPQGAAQNIEADPDVSDNIRSRSTTGVTNTSLSSTTHPTLVLEMMCMCYCQLFRVQRQGKADSKPLTRSRYTASLTSSIERYPIENGRRYHAFKDGSYIMPNDESELDRLDLSHQMFKITMGDKLYLAPIDNPARILDVGTGTGIWAIEMGDDFPDSEILGTDLSPTQPTWYV